MAENPCYFQVSVNAGEFPNLGTVRTALTQVVDMMAHTCATANEAGQLWDQTVSDEGGGWLQVSYCVTRGAALPSVEVFKELLPNVVDRALQQDELTPADGELGLYMSDPYLAELTPGGV